LILFALVYYLGKNKLFVSNQPP